MDTQRKPRPLISRPVTWAMALGMIAAMTACGTQVAGSAQRGGSGGAGAGSAPGGTSAQAATLVCTSTPKLNRMILTQRPSLDSGSTAKKAKMAKKAMTMTYTRAATVQSVARALCALPAMPKGRLGCPADFGNALLLAFSMQGRALPVITVDLTGCRSVTGLIPVRWWATKPGLLTSLDRSFGVKISTAH